MLKNGYGNYTEMPTTIQKSSSEMLSIPKSTRIISRTPGRLRLRIPQSLRQPEKIERIANKLKAHPQINDVQTNIHTGSITIQHELRDGKLKDVLATLRDLGVIFGDLTHGDSDAATNLTSAVYDLNTRVGKVTNGTVDLRFLFPLGLSALAVRQLLAKGLQLEVIPWYVLGWYAFDSFIKLHYTTNEPQPPSK